MATNNYSNRQFSNSKNEDNPNSSSKKSGAMDNQSLIEMCSKKLDQDPYHRKALLLRASSLIKKNDLEKALEDTKKLVFIDKENSTAFYLMGCIYEKLNMPEKAIDSYNQAVEIDPNNVNALLSRGACYNKLGNYQKAIDDYSIALEKDSLRTDKKTLMRNIDRVLGLKKENQADKSVLGNNQTNVNTTNNLSNILDNYPVSNSMLLHKSGINDLEGNELFDLNMNKINNYIYNQVNVPFNYKAILNNNQSPTQDLNNNADGFKQFQKNYNFNVKGGNLGNFHSPEKEKNDHQFNYGINATPEVYGNSNNNSSKFHSSNSQMNKYNFDNPLFLVQNNNESTGNMQKYALQPKSKPR